MPCAKELCSPFRSAGLSAGSCARRALATAKVKASACPVVPPPSTNAQTLYLSILLVAVSAHRALSRSCMRPNTSFNGLPFTRTSPVPSTTNALAVDAFLLPSPIALPYWSGVNGLATLRNGLTLLANCATATVTSCGHMLCSMRLRRLAIRIACVYCDALIDSPSSCRILSTLIHGLSGASLVGTVGRCWYLVKSFDSCRKKSLNRGVREKYDGLVGTERA